MKSRLRLATSFKLGRSFPGTNAITLFATVNSASNYSKVLMHDLRQTMILQFGISNKMNWYYQGSTNLSAADLCLKSCVMIKLAVPNMPIALLLVQQKMFISLLLDLSITMMRMTTTTTTMTKEDNSQTMKIRLKEVSSGLKLFFTFCFIFALKLWKMR